MEFKEKIEKLMQKTNLTADEIADKLNVSIFLMSNWQTGRSMPSLEEENKFNDFCASLHVEFEETKQELEDETM